MPLDNKALLELPNFEIAPSYYNMAQDLKIDWVALRLQAAYDRLYYLETMKSLPRTLKGATQRTLNSKNKDGYKNF